MGQAEQAERLRAANLKRRQRRDDIAASVKVGDRYGRLRITGPYSIRIGKGGRTYVNFPVRCDCGNVRVVDYGNLLKPHGTQSCGCLRSDFASAKNLTHGESKTRLYFIWAAMRNRCQNPGNDAYPDYGGRGIRVDPAWEDYRAFRDWAMANGYEPHLTVDRFPDVDGNYEPGNVRWATSAEQNRNRRDTRKVEAFGEVKCLAEWERDPRCGVNWQTIRKRLRKGMAPEQAIAMPRLR